MKTIVTEFSISSSELEIYLKRYVLQRLSADVIAFKFLNDEKEASVKIAFDFDYFLNDPLFVVKNISFGLKTIEFSVNLIKFKTAICSIINSEEACS